ncbi:unnamed protein product [Rhizopus stolonifer]
MSQSQSVLVCRPSHKIKDMLSNRRYSSYELMPPPSFVPQENRRFSGLFRNKKSRPENFLSHHVDSDQISFVTTGPDFTDMVAQALIHCTRNPSRRDDPTEVIDFKERPSNQQQNLQDTPVTIKADERKDTEELIPSKTPNQKIVTSLKTSIPKRTSKFLSDAMSLRRTVAAKTKVFCESADGFIGGEKKKLIEKCQLAPSILEKKARVFDFSQLIAKWKVEEKRDMMSSRTLVGGMTGEDLLHVKKVLTTYKHPYAWHEFLTPLMAKQLAEIQRKTNKKSKILNQYRMDQQLVILRLSNVINTNLSFLKAINANIKLTESDSNRVSRQIYGLESLHLTSPKVFTSSIAETSSVTRKSRYFSMLLNNPDSIMKKDSHPISRVVRNQHVTFPELVPNDDHTKSHKKLRKSIRFKNK